VAEFTIGGVTLEEFLSFFLLIVVAGLAAQLTYGLIRRSLDGRLGRRRTKVLANIVQYVIIGVALFYGLVFQLGLDLTAIAASLGIIGIAVAFSSQQIIQNFVAGLLITVNRPIQMEDWIEVGGTPNTGVVRVKDINLMSTVLRDRDGRIIYMPNSTILSSKIVNYTRSGFVELALPLEVSRQSDVASIKGTILEVADQSKKVLPNVVGEERKKMMSLFEMERLRRFFEQTPDLSMFEPKVLVSDFSSDSIKLSIRLWINEMESRDEIVSEFMSELESRLGAKGVAI
jgi:small conductance mechanosensitive channel